MTYATDDTRGQSVVRVLKLVRLLETARRGWTFYELSDRFGVSVRTVRRDVKLLQRIGLDVCESKREDSRHYGKNGTTEVRALTKRMAR